MFITNLEGNFFYQEELRQRAHWLTCAGVGDIDMPLGEPDAVYCQDPLNSGQLKIDGFITGVPGSNTYTLTKPLVSTWNFLLGVDCAFQGRINWVCRGSRQDPTNYQVALVMVQSEPRRRGIVAPVSFEPPEARVNTNLDLAFATPLVIHKLSWARQTVTNLSNANAVHFLPARCEDKCGPARRLCEYGLVGLDGPGAYAYESEIKKTHNSGATWAATALDPYSFGGDTSEVVQLDTVDGVVYIVFRGSAVVGAPAECAFSDDYGVTWTNRFIGNVFGQYVTAFTLRGADLIVGMDDGYIYISTDSAASWAVQEDGGEGAEAINGICFYGDFYGWTVGDANEMKRTYDGGAVWAALTGPAPGANLLSCDTNLLGQLFVGTDDGRLFRSEDYGNTWLDQDDVAGEWQDFGGGSVDKIEFEPVADYGAYLVYNDATPVGHVFRSEDGGASWYEDTGIPTNVGITDIHVCDINNVFLVGNVQGGYTFIAKSQIVMG